jgi:hypothetical protein
VQFFCRFHLVPFQLSSQNTCLRGLDGMHFKPLHFVDSALMAHGAAESRF